VLIVRHALHDVILAAIATNKIGIILFIGFRFFGLVLFRAPENFNFGEEREHDENSFERRGRDSY
jgi:hypothetical protein